MQHDIPLDPIRLTALDRIARQHRATTSGLNDRLFDLRAKRGDVGGRLDRLAARISDDPRVAASGGDQLEELRAELDLLTAQIAETEAEAGSAAAAAAAARINLRAAADLAEAEGLRIPVGIDMEDARRAR